MKTALPIAALSLAIGFAIGRWIAPSPAAAPTPLSSDKLYSALGHDTVAFLNWYGANGGADQIQADVLHDHIRILQSKAVEQGFIMDKGILLLPPDAK